MNEAPINNEDKQAWCEYGAELEPEFCRRVSGKSYGILCRMNPEKQDDPYAYDLRLTLKADLKTQKTPIFKAMKLYGIAPHFAVTLNVKDVVRYRTLYPNIMVIFDVRYENSETVIGGYTYRCEEHKGIYLANLPHIQRLIDGNLCGLILYQARTDDDGGNAKSSYVFDVRYFTPLKELPDERAAERAA